MAWSRGLYAVPAGLPCYTQTSVLCCGILHDTHVNSRREIYWLLVSQSGLMSLRAESQSTPTLSPSPNSTFLPILYLLYSFILCPDLPFILPSFWLFVSFADLLGVRGCWGGELWCTATGLFLSALIWQCSQVVTQFFTFFFFTFFSGIFTWHDRWSPLWFRLTFLLFLNDWACHGRTHTINLLSCRILQGFKSSVWNEWFTPSSFFILLWVLRSMFYYPLVYDIRNKSILSASTIRYSSANLLR